jgi:hypothetical protein
MYSIDFKTSVYQLQHFDVEIREFFAEGPYEYGDYTVTLKIGIENKTGNDWSSLEFCALVLNDAGQQIGEVNSKEDGITAGDSSEFELSIWWRVAGGLLNGDHEKYRALVKVMATSPKEKELGSYPVPLENYVITPLPELKIENQILVIGGSIWRAEPDSEGDINIHAKLSVQNLSDNRIPRVQFVANITNDSQELFDAGSTEELKCGDIQLIGGYGYSDEKNLKNATADCKLVYSLLVAESTATISGIDMHINEQEIKKSKSKLSWPKSSEENSDDEKFDDIEGGGNEFFVAVEKSQRIRANVVYEEINGDYVGVYFGYEGGGVSSDGFFCLDSKFKGLVTKDETDLPAEYLDKLYELQGVRSNFSDWEENDDGSQVSDFGKKYLKNLSAVTYDNICQYQSKGFLEQVLQVISNEWSLITNWPISNESVDNDGSGNKKDSELNLPTNLKEMNMSSKLLFKLVVEDSGEEVFSKPLSYETVANIVSGYDDADESNGFFALAAQHPASTVRENVAYKDKLSEEILGMLINDKSIPVLRNLVRTEAFKENAAADVIERLIKLDVEIAQNIAGDIDSYQQADASKLCTLILGLDDPSILASLAGNYSTPKKVLKELVNHSDPYVAAEAKRRLED